jgi:ankyrin repeat protein
VGCTVNDSDSNKRTALHYAAKMGALKTMDILLVAGADVNATDLYQQGPIL